MGIWEDDHFVCSLHFGREVVCLPPPLWIGDIKPMANIQGGFSIHWVALPTLSCVCVFSFVSLFLPNISDLHSPALECINPSRPDPNRWCPTWGLWQLYKHPWIGYSHLRVWRPDSGVWVVWPLSILISWPWTYSHHVWSTWGQWPLCLAMKT